GNAALLGSSEALRECGEWPGEEKAPCAMLGEWCGLGGWALCMSGWGRGGGVGECAWVAAMSFRSELSPNEVSMSCGSRKEASSEPGAFKKEGSMVDESKPPPLLAFRLPA